MCFVDNSNPPKKWKGKSGDSFDFGKLSRTGRSCSAEIVWLDSVSLCSFVELSRCLLCQDTVADDNDKNPPVKRSTES